MNPIPSITSFTPTIIDANSASFTLTVTGTNFVAASLLYWNGSPLTTTVVSETQITALVPQESVPTGGSYPVMVYTPPSEELEDDGGRSNILTFTASMSVSQATDVLTSYINSYRINIIGDHCTFQGAQWNTDPTSIANINGIVTIGMLNSEQLPPGQLWRDYNNNMVPVNFMFIAGLAVAVATFVQQVYAASWGHKANVAALTDSTSILAYDYTSTLWPDPNS